MIPFVSASTKFWNIWKISTLVFVEGSLGCAKLLSVDKTPRENPKHLKIFKMRVFVKSRN